MKSPGNVPICTQDIWQLTTVTRKRARSKLSSRGFSQWVSKYSRKDPYSTHSQIEVIGRTSRSMSHSPPPAVSSPRTTTARRRIRIWSPDLHHQGLAGIVSPSNATECRTRMNHRKKTRISINKMPPPLNHPPSPTTTLKWSRRTRRRTSTVTRRKSSM